MGNGRSHVSPPLVIHEEQGTAHYRIDIDVHAEIMVHKRIELLDADRPHQLAIADENGRLVRGTVRMLPVDPGDLLRNVTFLEKHWSKPSQNMVAAFERQFSVSKI